MKGKYGWILKNKGKIDHIQQLFQVPRVQISSSQSEGGMQLLQNFAQNIIRADKTRQLQYWKR